MFCFGTAVKLFYWSHLVYDIKEVSFQLLACSIGCQFQSQFHYRLCQVNAEITNPPGIGEAVPQLLPLPAPFPPPPLTPSSSFVQ